MNALSQLRFADRRFAWLGEPLPEVEVSFRQVDNPTQVTYHD